MVCYRDNEAVRVKGIRIRGRGLCAIRVIILCSAFVVAITTGWNLHNVEAAGGPLTQTTPAEVSGGGGCGGSTQSVYLTLGSNAWTPNLCFGASSI